MIISGENNGDVVFKFELIVVKYNITGSIMIINNNMDRVFG